MRKVKRRRERGGGKRLQVGKVICNRPCVLPIPRRHSILENTHPVSHGCQTGWYSHADELQRDARKLRAVQGSRVFNEHEGMLKQRKTVLPWVSGTWVAGVPGCTLRARGPGIRMVATRVSGRKRIPRGDVTAWGGPGVKLRRYFTPRWKKMGDRDGKEGKARGGYGTRGSEERGCQW